MFHTFGRYNERSTTLVIDGGHTVDVASKTDVTKLNLKVEPRPKPFKILWVNMTTLPMTKGCLKSIKMGDYEDEVYCDVIPIYR